MIEYRRCTEAVPEQIYSGFTIGFSDYMIKLQMSQEDFFKRFFGPEGNRLEHSFVALDGEKAVGVILGGIKQYEGVKTMRCGTLCIHPEYRGMGVSKELFALHKADAVEHGCRQMFLEVIVGNDRAIKFYNNLGYQKVYDLSYYSLANAAGLKDEKAAAAEVRQVDADTIFGLADRIAEVHINWQNDFDYIKTIEGLAFYGAYQDSELAGALCISPSGKVFFVWTEPSRRHAGIASKLIAKAVKELGISKLNISFPNNSKLEGFVRHAGFEKDKISQYEMYLIL